MPKFNGLKRHAALVPLSRDHHGTLVQARSLKLQPTPATARDFLDYFEQQLRGHMQDEERVVLPAADAAGVDGVDRIRSEHREIAAFASRVSEALRSGSDPGPVMRDLGQLLDDHVRYEERAFFEAVQRTLSPQGLEALGKALDKERETRGGPSCAVNLGGRA